ncbi:hypothetical protein D4764_04G0015180 [Takifugu flavidus]|uniref:Uncharacterized protein n=1 Tax=Takifugu flavidus TaxID=433684 RepID=A0A5C6N958_9TELE|nr:hypothetical protein D4764_04G0015180 [Takifugu flavidus]
MAGWVKREERRGEGQGEERRGEERRGEGGRGRGESRGEAQSTGTHPKIHYTTGGNTGISITSLLDEEEERRGNHDPVG